MTQRLEQALPQITAKKLRMEGRLRVVRLRDGPEWIKSSEK
jgi:hypothetical protein